MMTRAFAVIPATVRFAALLACGVLPVGRDLLAQTAPAVADSLPRSYRERSSAMADRRFAALWGATPRQFRVSWDSAQVADQHALLAVSSDIPPATREREEMRLPFRYVWGRTLWPYFR